MMLLADIAIIAAVAGAVAWAVSKAANRNTASRERTSKKKGSPR